MALQMVASNIESGKSNFSWDILSRIGRRDLIALVIVTMLTALAAAVSLYCAVNRLDGFNYRLADYATIYAPQEALSIVGLEAKRGAVSLQITGDLADGELVGPEPVSIAVAPGSVHITGMPKGAHTFRVESSKRPGLHREFTISNRPPALQITSPSLLIGRFARQSLADLATELEDYGQDGASRAVAKLREHGVDAGASSLETLRNLWQWLYPEMQSARGVPPNPDWLRDLPAYEQYATMVEGKASGYCTHMAEVHNLFGTVAGLTMRVVDVNGRLDGVNLTNHTFNEIWIPEQERWAYSDLQAGVLFVRDATTDQVVNAVQICQLAQAGVAGSLVATIYDPESKTVVDQPYELTGPTCRWLLHPSVTFVYHRYYPNRGSLTSWLDRYLVNPELAYMMQSGNAKHWIKMGAFGVLALGLLSWLLLSVRVIRKLRAAS